VLVTLVLYGGLFFLFLRVLPWVARKHPKARNLAAFVVETAAAWAAANALALIAASWDPALRPDAPALNALLCAAFAVGANYLGSNTATSPHPVYAPFLVIGVLMLLGSRPISVVVGAGTILFGAIAAFLKHRSLSASRLAQPRP
jgi:hypothetical protein